MTEELKGRLGLDTTDLKAGLAAANREIRVIESGFKASAAALGDWASSATGLESRIKALTGEIGIQALKVGALSDEYARVAAEKGEASRAAQELQIKLNQETERLNKMQTELGGTENSLARMRFEEENAGRGADELAQAQDRAAESGRGLDGVMSGLGTALGIAAGAIAAVGAAALGAAAGLTGIVLKAADAAGQLTDLSVKTGISTTKLQEFAFVGGQIGVSAETISGSLARLTRSMGSAQEGTGKAADAFIKLGISVFDYSGNLRDSEDVFKDTLAALSEIENEAERDALAMEIFGKSAMELNPLIKASADEMANMAIKARELGAVVAEEDIAALDNFGDTLDGLKQGLQGTATTLAADLLPAFQGLANGAEGYLKQLSAAVTGANGDIGKLVSNLGQILGRIAADLAAQAPKMLQAGLGIIQGILTSILAALPALIPAAVAIVTSLVNFLVQNLPLMVDAAVQLMLALVTGLLPMLPLLIDAALQMIITLAKGISQALPTLIPAIVAIIPQIILTLLENLPLLIDAALQLILALAMGLIQAIPVLIPYIPQIVTAIFNALVEALPMIGLAAVQLILTLAEGILTNLPLIITSARDTVYAYRDGLVALLASIFETAVRMVVELANGIASALDKIIEMGRTIVNTLVNAINSLKSTLMAIGKNIVMGVLDGIWANAGYFFEQVMRFFKDLIDEVKRRLHISSPSQVFAEIGENIALGLGVGFRDAIAGVKQDMGGLISGLTDINANINLGAGQLATQTATAAPNIYITINASIADQMDMSQLAMTLADEVRRLF